MNSVDYLHMIDPDHFSGVMEGRLAAVQDIYGGTAGRSFRFESVFGPVAQDVVWADDDMLLLFGSMPSRGESSQNQYVSGGDWIHVQFQIRGTSTESVGGTARLKSGSGSGSISRYPSGSIVERSIRSSTEWRAACLYFRPTVIASKLGPTLLPRTDRLAWLLDRSDQPAHAMGFTLRPREQLAVNDLFTCPFVGPLRRNYMHAKAMELFTWAMKRMVDDAERPEPPALTDEDRDRICEVSRILAEEIDSQLTLDQLARRVHMSRSKLAMGFRLMYGKSVQAYWRDMRLERARELLAVNQWSVTDVATAVGYADTSSLTRAFEKHFGVLPKDCRTRRTDRPGTRPPNRGGSSGPSTS